MTAPAVQLDGIPWQMRQEPRWGLWRSEARGASSTRPAEWTTFDRAAAVLVRGRRHDGLGFRLGEGWAGVDMDGCRDPETGALAPEAADIIEFMASYAEVSPSGNGGNPRDYPRCARSYTTYDYNYTRTSNEALHNHGHQIEILLNIVVVKCAVLLWIQYLQQSR